MTAPAIVNLTNQMKQLGQSGNTADLQLSEAARKKHTDLISDFRNKLKTQRDKATGLANYGNVGNFSSAGETKYWLTQDVAEFVKALDDYIAYLDQYEATVNAVHNRLTAEDNNN